VRNRQGAPYKPSVSRRMESSLRQHVGPRIGLVPIGALGRRDVKRLIDEIAAETSPETARKALNALSVVLRLAERNGLIERNPAERIEVPRNGDGEKPIRLLTPAEELAIVAAAEADDARLGRSLGAPLIVLALGSGLRLGELLALRWGPWGTEEEGLDLEGGVVRVRRSLDRMPDPETGEPPFVVPKTRAGRRDVPLDPADVARLTRHHAALARPARGTLVFARPDGGPLLATGQPTHAWRRARRLAGISEPLPRFHDTRHAWATTMLRAGLAPAAVARLGGWADVGMVHRRYGRHAFPDELEGAGQKLAAYRQSQDRRLS
jgi:integrase